MVPGTARGFLHRATMTGRVELSLECHGVKDEEIVRELCGSSIE